MDRRACRHRLREQGFTLIELLVVIAIIAILAAILFPVFAQARENARKSTCTSNVRQLSLGVLMYAQDYDETFPMTFNYGPALPPDKVFFGQQPTVWTWQNHAMTYVKNDGIWVCPSGWSSRSTWSGRPHRANGGYGGNDQVMRYGVAHGGVTGVGRMGMIKAPAETYLVMDAGSYAGECADFQDARHPVNYLPGARWNEKCFNSTARGDTRSCRGATREQAQTYWNGLKEVQPTADYVRDALEGRHNRRLTVAFVDGHAQSLDPDRVLFNARGWFDPPKARCIGSPPPY